MERQTNNNLGYLKNNDEHLHSLRSSRIPNYSSNYQITTSIKAPNVNNSKFNEVSKEDSVEAIQTQKKFPVMFTPIRKEENGTKQTLNNVNVNFFRGFGEQKNINFQAPKFPQSTDEENKENSSLLSNPNISKKFSSDNSGDSDLSGFQFKMPSKRTIFTGESNSNFQSVRMNLQSTFNNKDYTVANNIFDKNREENQLNTLISSSSSSSQSQNVSQSLNTSKEISIKNINNINNNCDEEETQIGEINFKPETENTLASQQTITETLLEGFNNKTKVSVPTVSIPKISNEEKFKLLAMKKARKPLFTDNKSVSNTQISIKRTGEEENQSDSNPNANQHSYQIRLYPQDMESDDVYHQNIYSNKRKKVSHSVKKVYYSNIDFTNPENGEKKIFKIYKDDDIGVNHKWQQYLRISTGDEDVPSDEDLINRATRHNLDHLMEACTQVITNKEFNEVSNVKLLQDK